MSEMTVSELGRRTGTSPDTIRYYERIGLLPDVARSPAGYRLFDARDAERLAFIKRAQGFGLQLDQIRDLLAVRDRGLCPCGHARQMLTDKLEELDRQREALDQLRKDIARLLRDEAVPGDASSWPCGPDLIPVPTMRRKL